MGRQAEPVPGHPSRPARPPLRAVAWFLAVSYGVGGPLGAFFEYNSSVLSERFDLPAALIYLGSVVQFSCALLVLSRRHARMAAVALSVTTIGAAGSHVRIGSPLTAIPALLMTALQIWFAARQGSVDEDAPA